MPLPLGDRPLEPRGGSSHESIAVRRSGRQRGSVSPSPTHQGQTPPPHWMMSKRSVKLCPDGAPGVVRSRCYCSSCLGAVVSAVELFESNSSPVEGCPRRSPQCMSPPLHHHPPVPIPTVQMPTVSMPTKIAEVCDGRMPRVAVGTTMAVMLYLSVGACHQAAPADPRLPPKPPSVRRPAILDRWRPTVAYCRDIGRVFSLHLPCFSSCRASTLRHRHTAQL